jgi:methylenetetrahydrofolate reductase (NADPH)
MGDRTHASAGAVAKLIEGARIEVVPGPSTVPDVVAHLPPGTPVAVASLPKHGPVRAVDTAVQLVERGYPAVPHMAARALGSRAAFRDLVARCQAAGVAGYFVIGGDTRVPEGPYGWGGDLIPELRELIGPEVAIGVAGYPEPHPLYSAEGLLEGLAAKENLGASYVLTQMCFRSKAVGTWAGELRRRRIGLPIVLGCPGVVARRRLLAMSARIGVSGALRFMRGNRRALLGLMASPDFNPHQLIADTMGALPAVEQPALGLHLYTFNQLLTTQEWRADQASAARGATRNSRTRAL